MEKDELSNHIKKAQSGSTESFGVIYDQFSQPLYRFIRAKTSGNQQAEDLLQETFIKAWKGLPLFNPDAGSFSGWLYKIALNAITDHYRKNSRIIQTVEIFDNLDAPASLNSEQDLDKNLSSEKLRQMLSQLPDNYRTVLELRFLSDLSIKETAQALNKSSLSVRMAQHRALKKLQTLIKQYPEHELR